MLEIKLTNRLYVSLLPLLTATNSRRCRKPRFHRYDLMRMSAKELKGLLVQLRIDAAGCIDKNELVDKVINSGKVDVIASPPPKTISLDELRSMKVKELRATMNNAGVFFDAADVVEKNDMIEIFANSGRVNITSDGIGNTENVNMEDDSDGFVHVSSPNGNKRKGNGSFTVDSKRRAPSPAPSASNSNSAQSLCITTDSLFSSSVSHLRQIARNANINISHCLEKGEIVKTLVESGKIELVTETTDLPGAVGDDIDLD